MFKGLSEGRVGKGTLSRGKREKRNVSKRCEEKNLKFCPFQHILEFIIMVHVFFYMIF